MVFCKGNCANSCHDRSAAEVIMAPLVPQATRALLCLALLTQVVACAGPSKRLNNARELYYAGDVQQAAQLLEQIPLFCRQIRLPSAYPDGNRHQQWLAANTLRSPRLLESLIGDPLVRRVLVDDHEAVVVLQEQEGLPVLTDEASEGRVGRPGLGAGSRNLVAGAIGCRDFSRPVLKSSLGLGRVGGM